MFQIRNILNLIVMHEFSAKWLEILHQKSPGDSTENKLNVVILSLVNLNINNEVGTRFSILSEMHK